MWGIIGGSGFEKFEGFKTKELLNRETPFGEASSGFKKVQVGTQECLFLSRHGEHHELLPSEVNYRANIYAMKAHGAKGIISFSAVGSLRTELAPGDLVIPTQYIDRTKGGRKSTFCGEGVVGHVSLAHPMCEKSGALALNMVSEEEWKSHFGSTYVCVEGPTFSTYAESIAYREMKADIIGMTNYPEYALAREAGLCYLPCCFVTDYDCWDKSRPHVTLEEVITVMRQNNAKAFSLAEKVLADSANFFTDCECSSQGLKMGLMTPKESLPKDKSKWIEMLLRD